MTCQNSKVDGVNAGKGLMAHDGQGGCETTGKAKGHLVSLSNPPLHSSMHFPWHAKVWRRRRQNTTLQPRIRENLFGYVLIITLKLLIVNAANMVCSEEDRLGIMSFLVFSNYLEPELSQVPPCFRDPCYFQVQFFLAVDAVYSDRDSLFFSLLLFLLSFAKSWKPEWDLVTPPLHDHGNSHVLETNPVRRQGSKIPSYLCNYCGGQARIRCQNLDRKSWLKFPSYSHVRISSIDDHLSYNRFPSYLSAVNIIHLSFFSQDNPHSLTTDINCTNLVEPPSRRRVEGTMGCMLCFKTYSHFVSSCMPVLVKTSSATMGKCQYRAANKGKQPVLPDQVPKKRGRRTYLKHLEELVVKYVMSNPSAPRNEIRGWEHEIHQEPEETETEAEILNFITDPGHTRGRLTLFNQTVHTYWIVKCLLAKAIQNNHPVQAKTEAMQPDQRTQSLLLEIQDNQQHLKITQYQTANRVSRLDEKVGRMEKTLQQILQQLNQAEMPGSNVKDPAPVSSSEV